MVIPVLKRLYRLTFFAGCKIILHKLAFYDSYFILRFYLIWLGNPLGAKSLKSYKVSYVILKYDFITLAYIEYT